jgi:protein-L-isoaspartate O-methyltransferase
MAKSPDQQGFAEGQAKYQSAAELPQRWTLKVAPDGRFVIPAAARAQMLLDKDGTVTARIEDGELKLISRTVAIRRIQRLIKKKDLGEGSVVDELIRERRLEAARE